MKNTLDTKDAKIFYCLNGAVEYYDGKTYNTITFFEDRKQALDYTDRLARNYAETQNAGIVFFTDPEATKAIWVINDQEPNGSVFLGKKMFINDDYISYQVDNCYARVIKVFNETIDSLEFTSKRAKRYAQKHKAKLYRIADKTENIVRWIVY